MTADLLLAGLTGLFVGSFVCLVSHRLPVMLERAWAAHCAESAHEALACRGDDSGSGPATGHGSAVAEPAAGAGERYDLLSPPSHCPACGHRLRVLEKVPLLSWLVQRGRCRACGVAIGWREPLVEVAAAGLGMLMVWRFGTGWDAALGALFAWMLLLASVIDIQRGWLPGEVTGPLLWAGLVANLGGRFATTEDAVIGAVAGYLSLWLVYWAFRLATGREGMGIGDLHLLAGIGAWVGWAVLPAAVLLSATLGILWAVLAALALGRSRAEPMPFGPMLSIAGIVALVWPAALNGLIAPGLAP